MRPSPLVAKLLATIGTKLASPSNLTPFVDDAADAEPAAAISASAYEAMAKQALDEVKAEKRERSTAEKAAEAATKAARSLALAVVQVAANQPPDVRAVHGWKAILGCPDRQALVSTIKEQLQAADALWQAAGMDAGNGPLAQVGVRGLTQTGGTPKPHQQARKALEAALGLANECALLAQPAGVARALQSKCPTKPVAERKRKVT